MSATWQHHAACIGHADVMFIGDRHTADVRRQQRIAAAQQICSTCPVINDCRTWILADHGPMVDHVIAGISPDDIATQRQRGRHRGLNSPAQGCGTNAGYQRHRRTGTDMCDDCRHAHNTHTAAARRFKEPA